MIGDVDDVVTRAVELSGRAGVPVVVRITGALHERCADRPAASPDLVSRTQPLPFGARLDTTVAHGLTKLGRYQRRVLVTEPSVQSFVDDADLLQERCADTCSTGVIAIGSAALAARDLGPSPQILDTVVIDYAASARVTVSRAS